MKLYYKPGACSLSPHIVLRESGLPFDLLKVDLATKTLPDGSDFRAVSPKGQVPALALDEGGILTEGAVIVQYIADKVPDSGLVPAAGTIERYRVQELLNFIGSELHKGVVPLFPMLKDKVSDTYRAFAAQVLGGKLAVLNQQLEGKAYLTGETFTVADAYAYTVLSWLPRIGFDLSPFPNLVAFAERVAARPAVQAAHAAEAQG
ncbi:glutathione S-transferase [Azospirillum lipoferum]|uniref:Glutathione transferase GstA n=1 Tax=Azospirillum lipoferum TaxID=193 RepID=A0A5A9GU96_AZOLI|nr:MULTISPECIES: glutathione transferase GstA [Azospirillum]KAA0597967.1 glutathione transferase GstA [Azospirillum lipoferum]MCP1609886.1 glutathione S-transferase [Azospirillum lipoferum]MDW5534621.1 glutathione transferase GstA [Azospirillum sp. NL1]